MSGSAPAVWASKNTETLVGLARTTAARRDSESAGATTATLFSAVDIKGMSTQDPHAGADWAVPSPVPGVCEGAGNRESYERPQHIANNSSIDRCWFAPIQRTSEPPTAGNTEMAQSQKAAISFEKPDTSFNIAQFRICETQALKSKSHHHSMPLVAVDRTNE